MDKTGQQGLHKICYGYSGSNEHWPVGVHGRLACGKDCLAGECEELNVFAFGVLAFMDVQHDHRVLTIGCDVAIPLSLMVRMGGGDNWWIDGGTDRLMATRSQTEHRPCLMSQNGTPDAMRQRSKAMP